MVSFTRIDRYVYQYEQSEMLMQTYLFDANTCSSII